MAIYDQSLSKKTSKRLSGMVEPLLQWYDRNARVLPWREEPTPYRVWISEIMLQQTRVEAAKPYFDRFTTALPNIQALAEISEEELLKLWEGLGYYNRVRNLQKCAKIILRDFGGELPKTLEELTSLPGIGPYTAGAIASIAYQVPLPAVDGNVLRVITRILACPSDITKESFKKLISQALTTVLPKRVGDFNQALMELGATICLPNGTPKCLCCPVSQLCRAYQAGTMMDFPVKPEKKKRRMEQRTVFLFFSNGKTALRKRPETSLLAGMWEFPNTASALTQVEAERWLEEQGFSVASLSPLPDAKHIFSHIEWHMNGFSVQLLSEPENDWVWVGREELEKEYAVPAAFKLYFRQALEKLSQRKENIEKRYQKNSTEF